MKSEFDYCVQKLVFIVDQLNSVQITISRLLSSILILFFHINP
jgi:hypothetical protein